MLQTVLPETEYAFACISSLTPLSPPAGAGADFTSYIHPNTKYDILQSAANSGHLDAVVKLVEAGAPWRLPKGQRVQDGSVFYAPEMITIERPAVKVC